MKLGISSYTYQWAVGLPDAIPSHPLLPLQLLEKARDLGVGLVQYGANMPLDQLPKEKLDEILQHASTWGIDLEMGTLGVEPQHLREQLRFAKRIGAILLKTTLGRPDGSIPLRTQIEQSLRAVLNELADGEIRLAIDNSRVPARELNEILECLHNPCLGAGLDTVHPLALPEGWQLSIRVLAHRTMSLHIKDFVVEPAAWRMGFSVKGCPVGKGLLNIPWLVESFARLRINPSAIVETWTPMQQTVEETIALEDAWAKQGVEFLRTFIPD
ncbi:MAG TPA: TIM barrel protein [Terriglobia bacterium]|nr:TIM barrel protein [Terriglobia bacterium]